MLINISLLFDTKASITLSLSFSFMQQIGFEYLELLNSSKLVFLIIPLRVPITIVIFVSKFIIGITLIISSSCSNLTILLTCFPKSFHTADGIR